LLYQLHSAAASKKSNVPTRIAARVAGLGVLTWRFAFGVWHFVLVLVLESWRVG
jgi:hypothetical protein